MKGENKILVNPYHTELINREIRKTRLQEAEQWRLIQEVAEPTPSIFQRFRKNMLLLWRTVMSRITGKREYFQLSRTAQNGTS